MSPTTETCACGASITVDVRDGLVLGFRLAEWRKEHQHDDEVERLRASLALQAESVENAAAEVARLREREARVEALRDRLAASTEVVGAKVLAIDVSRALREETT